LDFSLHGEFYDGRLNLTLARLFILFFFIPHLQKPESQDHRLTFDHHIQVQMVPLCVSTARIMTASTLLLGLRIPETARLVDLYLLSGSPKLDFNLSSTMTHPARRAPTVMICLSGRRRQRRQLGTSNTEGVNDACGWMDLCHMANNLRISRNIPHMIKVPLRTSDSLATPWMQSQVDVRPLKRLWLLQQLQGIWSNRRTTHCLSRMNIQVDKLRGT